MAFVTLVAFSALERDRLQVRRAIRLFRASFNNPYIWIAILVSFALLAVIMYVLFFKGLFNIVPLSAQDWALVLVWTLPVSSSSSCGKY